jgi:hypothetical protein
VSLCLLSCGCALKARKVPTPAAQITGGQLAQIPKPPDERFFLVFFGSHNGTRNPAYTHTWAALVRVRAPDAGPCGTVTTGCVDPALDVHTISWLPTKIDINALSFRVEPGANLELHRTIRNSLDTNQRIAMWGPYEVSHGFAHRFLVHKNFLDSGQVGYQCIDTIGEAARLGNGCDCIHAITDMDPIYPRWRYPLAFYGQPATANLVRRMMHSPIFIEPRTTHDWLIPRLGLDGYPIERRRYIGKAVEHEPGADLDGVALPLVPGGPRPKTPTPRTAPGTPPLPVDPAKNAKP